jgi:hypothetical protein
MGYDMVRNLGHTFPAAVFTSELLYGAAQKRAIANQRVTRNISSRLEECLRKGEGHLEDVVFKN